MSGRVDDRLVLASFVASAVLAGGNAVGIRFSNRELAPLWGAGLRFSLAAVILLVLMAALRLKAPRGRALTGVLLFGALNFGATFALAYYALVRLHAGFGQILLALVPLATILLAAAWRQERLRAEGLLGALVALGGVAVMSRAPLRGPVPLPSLLAALGSALCFAQAAVLVRRFPVVHPVTMNALGMATGAVLLVTGALLAGEPTAIPDRAATWAAVGYLVVVGSVAVFLLYLFVLQRWPASRAAYGFVIIPVVTVALSAWLDDEPIGLGLVLGGLLVLAGVYVGALRRRPARAGEPAAGPVEFPLGSQAPDPGVGEGPLPASAVPSVELPDECLDLFDRPLLASAAILLDDGSPHVTPVWVMRRGDRLVLNTARSRAKARSLERDPRIALCVLDSEDDARYVQVRGVASLSADRARETIDELSRKYTGRNFRPLLPGEERLDVVIAPQYVDYHPEHDLTKAIRVRLPA